MSQTLFPFMRDYCTSSLLVNQDSMLWLLSTRFREKLNVLGLRIRKNDKGFNEILQPVFQTIDWRHTYTADNRFDVVHRAIEVLMDEFIKKVIDKTPQFKSYITQVGPLQYKYDTLHNGHEYRDYITVSAELLHNA